MPRKIAYYITAHGYGHAVRSSYLINELGRECQITILTDIPRAFFDEELTVPFNYRAAVFDCGCVQKDALTVDAAATEQEYYNRSMENELLLPQEVEWIHKNKIELIISDMVPFAGYIGNKAQIPAVSVSNFWWDDIYRSFPDSEGKQWLVHRVEGEMSYFSHHVILNPPMRHWNSDNNTLAGVNLLREARDRRTELHEHLGIEQDKKVALLYTGNYGMAKVDWKQLEKFTEWHFIGLYKLESMPTNFSVISKELFSMQEFSASVDLVISKLGYGTVMESLATGTPILYTPREGFAEYPVLEEYLNRYGHCLKINEESFNRVDWDFALNRLYKMGKRHIRLSSDTTTIADWILAIPRSIYNS